MDKLTEAQRILGGPSQVLTENYRNADLTGLDLTKLTPRQIEQLALGEDIVMEVVSARYERSPPSRSAPMFHYRVVLKTSAGNKEELCIVMVSSLGKVTAYVG